jgi:hypothetical protein
MMSVFSRQIEFECFPGLWKLWELFSFHTPAVLFSIMEFPLLICRLVFSQIPGGSIQIFGVLSLPSSLLSNILIHKL